MGWMIYILLGVGIILLCFFIVRLTSKKKEGLSNYFNIDEYLNYLINDNSNTIGRYIHIMPRPLKDGANQPFLDENGNEITDNTMYISQIMVFDMDNRNIAKNATIEAHGQKNTIDPKIIIDGNRNPRAAALGIQGNTCTDGNNVETNPKLFNIQICDSYVIIDLGATYQISAIGFVGKLAANQAEGIALRSSNHMIVFQLLDENFNEIYKDILPTGDTQQMLQCPNAFRTEASTNDPSIGPTNPNLVKFNYGLEEVFCINTVGPRSNAELLCNIVGARLATSGQVQEAFNNNAEWCTPGWVKDSTNTSYYPSQLKNCKGQKGINGERATTAGAICLGVKPALGSANATNIQDFNKYYGGWSLYDLDNMLTTKGVRYSLAGQNFGGKSFVVPNSTLLKEFVYNTFLPVKILPVEWQSLTNPSISLTAAAMEQYNLRPPLPRYSPLTNPFYEFYLRNSPINWLYDMRSTATTTGPLFTKFPLSDPRYQVNVKIFGDVPSGAITDISNSLNLCTKLYFSSAEDIYKFVSIKYSDVAVLYPSPNSNPDAVIASINSATIPSFNSVAYVRNGVHPDFAPMGTRKVTSFCRAEIIQQYEQALNSYKIGKTTDVDITWNNTYCSEKITSDYLGLLPEPTRKFLIEWIYNRTSRYMQQIYGTQTDKDSKPTDGYGIKLSPAQVTSFQANLERIQAALVYMKPTVNGVPNPVDFTNKFILDTVAQSFYEIMGGMSKMTLIYDVFTIGGSTIDIRFDLTKHKDNTASETQIANLKSKYYALRASNVSQDVLDTAKAKYLENVAKIREAELTNIYPPITGVVGRFFYTYNATNSLVTITGFTLDARAVTSFIPELNGGMYVSTGSDAGTLNYVPNTVYTMNVPQPLNCSDEETIRRIMDDYIDATKDSSATGLATTLLNATPSIDTTEGSVKIRSIIGSTQISKTQCAITWKEALWDDIKNVTRIPEVTRNALFSYTSSTADWYSSDIVFDATGFKYFPDANVPKCVFNPTEYQKSVSPLIDDITEVAKIRDYFITNTFNNGAGGFPCPDVLPTYKFNIYDYVNANPTLNTTYNSGSTMDVTGIINNYKTTGITNGEPLRSAQPIKRLVAPIVIPQPIPPSSDLDNASGACPTTACDDLNVLYIIANSYNNDVTQPGAIMRITRAYTANQYQCDIEAEINYDSTVTDAAGDTVQKGSFTYSSDGTTEIPTDITLPTGIKKSTFGINVHTEITTCNVVYDGSNGIDTGTTILPNTPALYKPLEYATEYANRNLTSFNSIVNGITGSITDTARAAASILGTYRANTANAVGAIATLGPVGTCSTKCSDTTTLNSILAYYKANPDKVNTQMNTILYAGTVDEKTCDITFQEDTLSKVGTTTTISSSQTSGIRFTMGLSTSSGSSGSSGSNQCKFSVTGMTRTLPTALDMSSPAFINCSEVYYLDGSYSRSSAENMCKLLNGVVATKAQVNSAMLAGADWCTQGWVADISGSAFAPVSANLGFGCPTTKGLSTAVKTSAGVNCYGPKPPRNKNMFVKEFSKNVWSQNACPAFVSYVNPSKEGFHNYGPPIQVTESTFPLNTPSFGLDGIRNKESHLETLYKEPLRHDGSKYLTVDEPLEKSKSYRYIRFRPMLTRDPKSESVSVGKFRFFLGKNEIDLTNAKASNPMGTWIGDAKDITGPGYKHGWTDHHKKSIIFAFPYPVLMDGFTWTTTNPDMGIGCDPVQWKLEGSQNGTFWTILRDQARNYPVPTARFQELPIFNF